MTGGTILVHFNDLRRAKRLLAAAVPMARAAEAHLVGLCVLPPFIPLPAADGTGVSVTLDQHRTAFSAEMIEMKRLFLAGTSDLPKPAEWREADAGFEAVARTVLDHGRAADLIVASQADPEWGSSSLLEDPVRIVMESGRPVLLVPNAGRDVVSPPRRVMVAWDSRREASRAAFDALPWIRRADETTLISINPEKAAATSGDLPAAEICAALARHGAKPQAIEAQAIGADVGAELLRQARLAAADVLVMGCYGHSRLRELILGGATRHILKAMDLPVLLSH